MAWTNEQRARWVAFVQSVVGTASQVHTHTFTEVTDKPDTYPPATHTHDPQPPASHSHTFAEVTDKPTDYPPSTHSHTNDHAPGSDNQDLSGLQPKETGKGLSSNDLTAELKTTYDGAAAHAASSHADPTNATTAYNHSQAVHAPATAQKNSDITKEEIEAKLTGPITSHSHAGGTSPTTTCKQSAQVTNNSSTTPTDITGLAFTLVAGHRYYFRFMGTYQSAATTTGAGFTFTGPAVTAVNWSVTIQQAAAGTDHNYQNSAVALATVLVSTACIAANTDYMWQVEGFITPSANGTLQLRCRSEVNASQITIKNVGIGILEDAG